MRHWLALLAALFAVGVRAEAPPAAAPPTVAVLYFDYDGSNEQLGQLRKGIAQMLTSDLSQGPARIVERARLQDVLDELELAASKKFDAATAARVGKLLGAQYLVLGSYFEMMGALRVDARIVETETGRIIQSAGGHGKPDDFLVLERSLAEKLLGGLGGIVVSTATRAPPPAARPPVKASAKVPTSAVAGYGRALDALDKKDKATAKRELEAVVAATPGFTLAAVDLSRLAM